MTKHLKVKINHEELLICHWPFIINASFWLSIWRDLSNVEPLVTVFFLGNKRRRNRFGLWRRMAFQRGHWPQKSKIHASPGLVHPKASSSLHPWRLTAGTCPHGGERKIIFPSKWVICRFQPLIFQGVYISGQFFFDQTAGVPGKWVGFSKDPGIPPKCSKNLGVL